MTLTIENFSTVLFSEEGGGIALEEEDTDRSKNEHTVGDHSQRV